MTAYFVTATGTNIGKTFVTAGLIRALRDNGRKVSALKPIVSGFDVSTSATSDTGLLLQALEKPITPESLEEVSPWRFAAPLSPDMAAAREGRTIEFDDLVKFCRDAAVRESGTLLIEGVGGIMVPLDGRQTVLDWARALSFPLIVVTGSYLGTISHTLTAMDVIVRARLRVAALIVNDSGDGAVPLADTITTLRRFMDVPIVALPRVETSNAARHDFVNLAAML